MCVRKVDWIDARARERQADTNTKIQSRTNFVKELLQVILSLGAAELIDEIAERLGSPHAIELFFKILGPAKDVENIPSGRLTNSTREIAS